MTDAVEDKAPVKIRIATTSLAGCFGCHMSLLDIDERLLELAEIAEFDRTPLTDIKHCSPCDIALIEGGVCNAENVHVLDVGQRRAIEFGDLGELEQPLVDVEQRHMAAKTAGERGRRQPDLYRRLGWADPIHLSSPRSFKTRLRR